MPAADKGTSVSSPCAGCRFYWYCHVRCCHGCWWMCPGEARMPLRFQIWTTDSSCSIDWWYRRYSCCCCCCCCCWSSQHGDQWTMEAAQCNSPHWRMLMLQRRSCLSTGIIDSAHSSQTAAVGIASSCHGWRRTVPCSAIFEQRTGFFRVHCHGSRVEAEGVVNDAECQFGIVRDVAQSYEWWMGTVGSDQSDETSPSCGASNKIFPSEGEGKSR